MRRLLIGMVVAAATALVPSWALAGNQEVAEQIAARLRDSGQMHGYKIGVKFQEGTAWLKGQVVNQEQLDTAMKIVSQTPGVVRVENGLTISGEKKADSPATPAWRPLQQMAGALAPDQGPGAASPALRGGSADQLRGETYQPERMARASAIATPGQVGRAERVPTSFSPVAAQTVAAGPVDSFAAPANRRLEPVAGALRPDQFPGSVSPGLRAAPTDQLRGETYQPERIAQALTTRMPQQAGRAEPVPTSFTSAPAQPVAANATQQPTLAPAPMAGSPGTAPAVAPLYPQPLPAGTPAVQGAPLPIGQAGPVASQFVPPVGAGMPPARYDQPSLPNYAWPAYAAHPNYAAVTYPKQYSPTAWPYIGPFYPYPQVPMGWRKVSLEWHDGWWNLDFDDGCRTGPLSGLFRAWR